MKLQQGEYLILELRRSRFTLMWPVLKALIGGGLAFLYFWLLFWCSYEWVIPKQDAAGNKKFENEQIAAAFLGVTFLLYLMGTIVVWVRRRRAAREAVQAAEPSEDEGITAEMAERKKRKIVSRRIARSFTAEKLIGRILMLLVVVLLLFLAKIGTWWPLSAHLPAICLAVVILVFMLAFSVFCWRKTHYYLTTRRIVTEFGWFSRNVWEIPLAECRHIEGKRNLFQKMFGYGHLTIAGVGTISKYLAYVPKPTKFREALNEALQAARPATLDAAPPPADEATDLQYPEEPETPEPPAEPEPPEDDLEPEEDTEEKSPESS